MQRETNIKATNEKEFLALAPAPCALCNEQVFIFNYSLARWKSEWEKKTAQFLNANDNIESRLQSSKILLTIFDGITRYEMKERKQKTKTHWNYLFDWSDVTSCLGTGACLKKKKNKRKMVAFKTNKNGKCAFSPSVILLICLDSTQRSIQLAVYIRVSGCARVSGEKLRGNKRKRKHHFRQFKEPKIPSINIQNE